MTRAAAVRREERRAGPRKRRGSPAETRRRLVMAAAREIEERGYHGTDTNRIARAAGYGAATFYKHFSDKRAVFLAVYQEWVTREWLDIPRIVNQRGRSRASLAEMVDAVLEHHRRWPGFRDSLRALVALDPEIRRFHRKWRRRQLALVRRLSGRSGPEHALLLLVCERIADALADGELSTLGVPRRDARAFLVDQFVAQFNAGLDVAPRT